MSTSAERTYHAAVAGAENTRQNAKSAAVTAYANNPANLGTFQAALIAADVAFINSVTSAASTAGIAVSPSLNGPLPHGNWCKIGSS
jgi:hypothetical protein